jgi:DNA-directed RNA polymerase specialized sigma24 family protein
MPADPDLTLELRNVERARTGDHDAFVALYRQHAPLAWRLALALTADPELAADAVTTAFARALAPLPAGAARSDVPFHLRLLTATRHAVLDAGTSSPSYISAGVASSRPVSPATDAMQAFHRLPERWRTVLWLLAVEGIGTGEAAWILEVPATESEDLAERASAGLRTQWLRDRQASGDTDPVAPEHLDRLLQTVLPLPLGLFEITEARWQTTRRPVVGHIGLVFPGGRPVPRWAERGLLAGAAALIALGITSAVVVDRDPDVRRARGEDLAADPPTTLGAGSPPEPKAYLDGEDGVRTQPADEVRARTASTATTLAAAIAAASAAGATPVAGSTASPPTAAPPTDTTSSPLQVTAAVGHTLGLGLGACTGLELAGQVVGCAPPSDDGPITLDVSGTLGG